MQIVAANDGPGADGGHRLATTRDCWWSCAWGIAFTTVGDAATWIGGRKAKAAARGGFRNGKLSVLLSVALLVLLFDY